MFHILLESTQAESSVVSGVKGFRLLDPPRCLCSASGIVYKDERLTSPVSYFRQSNFRILQCLKQRGPQRVFPRVVIHEAMWGSDAMNKTATKASEHTGLNRYQYQFDA